MVDSGSSNFAVGHRRWILYPPQKTIGTGSVAAVSGFSAANALWVSGPFGARPATPEGVPWPNRGFVPYQILPARWSFSYPGASFGGATVSMWRGSTPVPMILEPQSQGYGDNALVWLPQLVSGAPGADVIYRVQLDNVMIGGQARQFTYDVTVFDPASSAPAVPGIALGDFNGEGKADILWRHTSGLVHVWLMDGTSISRVGSPGSAGLDWTLQGIATSMATV